MKISRRKLLLNTTALAGAGALASVPRATEAATPAATAAATTTGTETARGNATSARVHTLNGASLPWQRVDGAKQFHLTASEFEHEFAPGSKARCWGYNGTTPGPTIEAVEGDRVRILVTNNLPEPTSVHWHGLLLPNGMDGVAGLTQPAILPGETWAYEFTLRQHGTCMYHPHADEMTQMAFGMMGLFIIHPKGGEPSPIAHDFAFLLHNWALHPGTYRPDPSIMTDFNLWTFNSRVFPAIEPLVVGLGERVRIRIGNLSMFNHPIHLHGHRFHVTGSDAGRWPQSLWRPEVTEIVGVGQTRDIEFIADNPGDWALHCHMSHHTMNAMGHGVISNVGVDQSGVEARVRAAAPGYMAMGTNGMFEPMLSGMAGPANTLPMTAGQGPFGPIAMGGMFTVVKVRERPGAGADAAAAGWYSRKDAPRARRVAAATPAAGSTPEADRKDTSHAGDMGDMSEQMAH